MTVLREMLRVSRRGVIVNDLLRSHWARLGTQLITLFAAPIEKHDGVVSIDKAWTRDEVEQWKITAGAPWLTYHWHIAARFTLAGERPQNT